MNQPYFIVVFAHSFHGRLKRIHVHHHLLWAGLALALIGAVTVFGFVSSYVRMTMKVASYNNLRREIETLRDRYQRLEKQSKQTDVQLASLQLLAHEVSAAYGIKRETEVEASPVRLLPSVTESLETYNFLKSASLRRSSLPGFAAASLPSIWPIDGRLMSHFGRRQDPFSGEGAFHTGVDISASHGTPIRAAADGIVAHASWGGDYGRLVVVEHGNGVETWYAHLSRFDVVNGQSVRRGDTVGRAGATGRATSSHLHYEVRRGGTAVNPYQYLKTNLVQTRPREYGL